MYTSSAGSGHTFLPQRTYVVAPATTKQTTLYYKLILRIKLKGDLIMLLKITSGTQIAKHNCREKTNSKTTFSMEHKCRKRERGRERERQREREREREIERERESESESARDRETY